MSTTNAANTQVRAGCYLRISSDPKDKREGVERQREDTTILCEVQGWTPVSFYVDNDRSASNGKGRPEWNRLLADIGAGKVDAIVVWNQDRGWRKMADLESLRPLLAPRGILLATTNIGVVDFRNADDVFRAQVSTALSEMEIAKMRVRQRRAARQRAEQGRPKWRRAFGYVDMGGDCREPDPQTAPLVKRAYAALIAGASLSEIAAIFNDAGAFGLNGQPWTASTVSLFLRSARNAGLRGHNGEIVIGADGQAVKGTWPGLVEESTWRTAQSILSDPRRAPGPKTVRQHLLTGVVFCGKCGRPLAGMQTLKKTVAYRCRPGKGCGGVGVAGAELEPLLYKLVGGRLAMPDAVDLLRAEAHDEAEAERVRLRLSELYADVTQIGIERAKRLLTGEQAKAATDYLQAEVAELEASQRDDERMRVFDGIPLGQPEAVEAVKALSPDRFRAVVQVVMRPVVQPVGKGSHVFNPQRVQPNWVAELD